MVSHACQFVYVCSANVYGSRSRFKNRIRLKHMRERNDFAHVLSSHKQQMSQKKSKTIAFIIFSLLNLSIWTVFAFYSYTHTHTLTWYCCRFRWCLCCCCCCCTCHNQYIQTHKCVTNVDLLSLGSLCLFFSMPLTQKHAYIHIFASHYENMLVEKSEWEFQFDEMKRNCTNLCIELTI